MVKRLNTKKAVEHLKEIGVETTSGTLEVYRCKGKGPKFFKVGHRVFYDPADLDRYAEGQAIETRDSLGDA